jgi:acetoin utilization deacetylase AcuC-like enzyme
MDISMTTVYVTHPRLTEHDLTGHHEHAGRIRAIWAALAQGGLTARMQTHDAESISDELALAVHDQQHLDLLRHVAQRYRQPVMITPDTYFCPTSFEVARLAAGGVVTAIDDVLSGRAANGLAVVRPPGHHATPDTVMGFCLLNSIAIGARFAQRQHSLKRVMIIDYDIHHGNGTEAAFSDDPSVLFLSTHQSPLYPGTGALNETGYGAGEGATINVPIPPGYGDAAYAAIFEEIVWKAAGRFQPELMLVSAGFDGHWRERLSMVDMRLTVSGYAHLNRELVRMAEALCGGRIVFVTEGGYDLDALSYSVASVARALLHDAHTDDPLGEPKQVKGVPHELIARVKTLHGL